ncbi:MAG TPA: archaemetzincin family Zn-dependent metalloprotease [Bacteroidales bacterium]|nr:archaemetzincin family Zn-dependent metalloprotease [Bacteroidales bacterium]
MTDRHITLLNYGYFDKKILTGLAELIIAEFQSEVVIVEDYFEINNFYDASRKQYNGNQILRFIDSRSEAIEGKIVGLFNVDLFIPILTYIFGQAYLGGKTAIASGYRLANERYGLPGNESLFQSRLTKEVHHELGHCFGLIHCHNPGCVMQSSTYVEDIDQKTFRLCQSCSDQIR